MKLIEQLKSEHKQILRSVLDIDAVLKGKEDKKYHEYLGELKDLLVSHMEVEYKLLYPFFEKNESNELKTLGQSFSKEMAAIAKIAMAFLDKYSDSEKDLVNNQKFKDDFNEVSNTLKKRVSIEENILFPAYLKYHS